MKKIIYCIYYAGAIVFGLCTAYLEPIAAAVTTIALPIILLHLAEMTGRVRIMRAPEPTTPIEISMYQGLSDEESINRFGWSMIVEMDKRIEETKQQLDAMHKSREAMAELYKKESK